MCMLSAAHMQYTMRLCAGVFFNCLYVLSWVSMGPEGCAELNWIHLATCGHCTMTGISPLTVLTKQGRFPSSATTSSPSCDSEYVSFWPKLPFKWGRSSDSRDGIGLLVYSVNWHFLHFCISVSALIFQSLLPFQTCKNISISDLTAFAAVGASLLCRSVSVLPATFTALLTLPLKGKEQDS